MDKDMKQLDLDFSAELRQAPSLAPTTSSSVVNFFSYKRSVNKDQQNSSLTSKLLKEANELDW